MQLDPGPAPAAPYSNSGTVKPLAAKKTYSSGHKRRHRRHKVRYSDEENSGDKSSQEYNKGHASEFPNVPNIFDKYFYPFTNYPIKKNQFANSVFFNMVAWDTEFEFLIRK